MISLGDIKLLTDREALDNLANYIRDNVGRQDWATHIDNVSGYIAAALDWPVHSVTAYLKTWLY